MNRLIYITFLLLPLWTQARQANYLERLQAKVTATDSNYCTAEFRGLVNLCDRIIHMNRNEWLPVYYKAYANTHLGFLTEDEEKKDRYYDQAQESLVNAMEIRPNESENFVLQALICFGRMEISPMTRAMIYFPKASEALEKAKKLNPKNPRVYYLQGQSLLYKPSFMGGGKKAARPYLVKALELYQKTGYIQTAFPHWGQEATLRLYRQCKKVAKKSE